MGCWGAWEWRRRALLGSHEINALICDKFLRYNSINPCYLWIKEENMSLRELKIPYSDDLLLSLKESPAEFEAEARLLLAVKLYELGKVTTGMAARR